MNRAKEWVQMMASLMKQSNQAHSSLALLELGKEGVIEPFTPAEQRLIKALKKVVKPERKQCYANAQRAIFHAADYGNLCYVEGFFSGESLPIAIEHAWLTLNGKVLEITPSIAEPGDYFGLEISEDQVEAFCMEGKIHGQMLSDYHLGFKYATKLLRMEDRLANERR